MKTIVFFLICIFCTAFSQQNEFASYYPLNVGNIWMYSFYYTNGGYSGWIIKKIDSSFVINGHKYFRLQPNYSKTRVDSFSANVMSYDNSGGCNWSPYEKTTDSLAAKINDSLRLNCLTDRGRCVDTNYRTIFGVSRRSKHFFTGVTGRVYVNGIGITDMYTGQTPDFYSETLIACVINGIVYGDTSLIGITRISSAVPNSFTLSQNYPNPFNPTTIIKFDLPAVGQRHAFDVKLIICDILGREVVTLVNQQMQPGSYSVDWDGTSYPSGVYFYQLTINGEQLTKYTETKKMVLIK